MVQESEVSEKVAGLKQEIDSLTNELNRSNQQKEIWFKKRDELQKQITDSLNRVKGFREGRNKLTDQVKISKEERTKFNEEIKKKVEELKKLKAEAAEKRSKVNPGFLKSDIEKLELSIETQALKFSEEQKRMKKIKEKKKQLAEVEKSNSVFGKINTLSKELDGLRVKADEIHKQVKTKADESQERHEEVIKILTNVKESRKKLKEVNKNCSEFKKKYGEANTKLQEKLMELSKLGPIKVPEKTKSPRDILKQKEREVEEKIRKKQTLTTKDLLVMQSKR